MSFIVDILEEFLGPIRKHNESTGQISFDCCRCSEEKGVDYDKKGNLEINYQKGIFHCWSCGASHNMQGVIEKLIKKYGTVKNLKNYILLKPETNYKKEKEDNNEDLDDIIAESNLKLPEGFKLLKNCNNKDYKYEQVISYLKERGIGEDIINEYNIGYTTQGKYYNRIIIPSYDENGNLNYFIARSFDKKVKPKYLNPDAEKQIIIFNENKINWDSTIYIVEGSTDSLPIPNSIPLLGKVISDYLKSKLITKAKALIVILLDSDAKLDTIRLFKELNTLELYGRVKIIIPPDGYDPSKIYEVGGKKMIIKLLKNARLPTDYELTYLV